MTKEETYAPKVSMEALILSFLMYVKEGRDVAIIYIPGDFMHDDMKVQFNMKLESEMTDLFSKIEPQIYEEYVTVENG